MIRLHLKLVGTAEAFYNARLVRQQQRIEIHYLYVRIKDDKIWIEEDYTEAGIATPIVAAGVPNQDLVLAFHRPDMRSLELSHWLIVRKALCKSAGGDPLIST